MTSRKENGYNTVLATRLRQVIDKKRLKQSDIATSAGVSRQAISGYADGNIVPKADTLAKIAKYLDVSADYLLGLSDNECRHRTNNIETCGDIVQFIGKLQAAVPTECKPCEIDGKDCVTVTIYSSNLKKQIAAIDYFLKKRKEIEQEGGDTTTVMWILDRIMKCGNEPLAEED